MSRIFLSEAGHRLNVRKLYKSILRLHRGLPEEAQILGDKYVKDEFRRHKDVPNLEFVRHFMLEWTDYAVILSKQLNTRAMVDSVHVGCDLTEEKLDSFSNEQLFQLHELKTETEKAKVSTRNCKVADAKDSR